MSGSPKCAGTTKAGRKCSRAALPDSRFCSAHRVALPSVRDAVADDLKRLAERGVKSETLAATAMRLAEEMDSSTTSATAKAACAKGLADVMARLEGMATPVASGDDPVAAATVKREKRRAASNR